MKKKSDITDYIDKNNNDDNIIKDNPNDKKESSKSNCRLLLLYLFKLKQQKQKQRQYRHLDETTIQQYNYQLYSKLRDEQYNLRSRTTEDYSKMDDDEFSNLQLYKTRQVVKKSAYNNKKRKSGGGHFVNNKKQNNFTQQDNDDDDDDDDDEGDDDYCCDCTCCRIPWPIPPGVEWCVKDVCGIVCAGVTWSLILYAEYVVMFIMILPAPLTIGTFLNTIIFQSLAILAFASHWNAMFTDPGVIPLGNATPENIEAATEYAGQIIYRCPRCICIKPMRAHHCSVCRRCVKKMDHHCP
jgi:hypothetical protein